MNKNVIEDVIVLGAGPAGYTAAIYAARAGRKPLLISGLQPGGQLMVTSDVENYPGFATPVQGPWLMDQMLKQAEHVGTRIVYDLVTAVDLSGRPFRLKVDSGDTYRCNALIVATGAQAKWLGLPSEEYLRGKGVSACATCDGFFFRNKRVVVIGGGNSAVEEALYLSQLAASVTLIHRRDTLRAERILQDRLSENPRITIRWNAEVSEILGDESRGVSGVRLRNTETDEFSDLGTDGVFVAIGHQPATALFARQLELAPSGYIKVTPGSTVTSVAGVFAAGDVADDTFRQAVTAAGLGCMAALEADRYLIRAPFAAAAESRVEVMA